MEFFEVLEVSKAFKKMIERIEDGSSARVGVEEVPLPDSLMRVLGQDVIPKCDLPPFDRSTVDGYAVRAKDTFGASESIPALLTLSGEVKMGKTAEVTVGPGEAVKIPTGGMLPKGSDSVVMVEDTGLLNATDVEVRKASVPGENVVRKGDDIASGEVFLSKGRRLRPQEIAALAGLGFAEICVYKRPRVAVISTGDEIVSFSERPSPGEIRDMNSPGLCASVVQDGGEPGFLGIAKDDHDDLKDALQVALSRKYDMVLISGGSSVGTRDVTLSVINELGQPGALVHGLALQPGKPAVLGAKGSVPIIGLPGHPVSAMVVYRQVVRPLLAWTGGEDISLDGTRDDTDGRRRISAARPEYYIEARLERNLHSSPGREEWVRVKLEKRGDQWAAVPLLGGSAMISTLVKADGLVCIPLYSNGIAAGETVKVFPW